MYTKSRNRNQLVIPTGYMGSGSSAITDLLKEVKGYYNKNGNFEYIFMHCPNGVFDLEYKLLWGNNALRSDEAIYMFRKTMNTLYLNKHYWFTDYSNKISSRFMEYVDKYIDDLTDSELPDSYWYFHEMPSTKIFIHKIIRKLLSIITFNKILLCNKKNFIGMRISYPDEEFFYTRTKCFLKEVFVDLGILDHNIVLDQFLLPHNLYKYSHYFDSNCKVIVVDRDPRDVFLLNKYYWHSLGVSVPYPIEVKAFCEHYLKMRNKEIMIENENILRLHFEDLVYDYEKTKKYIFRFLAIQDFDHLNVLKYFNPSKSINNTQVFRRDTRFKKEAYYIEKKLEEYIYQFLYIVTDSISDEDIIV